MKKEGIDIFLKPVGDFIREETTGGILLLVATIIGLVWANSSWHESYEQFRHVPFAIGFGDLVISKDLHHWINDGLMAIFFFVIGLELKREFIGGELSTWQKAALPLAAGAGGMLIPALIFIFINKGTPYVDGWGIPMATDIAFVLGILALLGKRIPFSLKIFLTALAIADDLGAVLVIALFYTSDISLMNIGIGAAVLLVMIGANLLGVRSSAFYAIMGISGLWMAFLLSGVHATVAGVLAAFAIPARTKIDEERFVEKLRELTRDFRKADPNDSPLITSEQLRIIGDLKEYNAAAETPLQRIEHTLHPFVAFIVMPVFALANAGFPINTESLSFLLNPLTIGVFLGLVAGKFIGIAGMTRLMVGLGFAKLPENTTWRHIYGVALLGGVGFTMSLFITELAFADPQYAQQAKLGTLIASLVAGVGGYLLLRKNAPPDG